MSKSLMLWVLASIVPLACGRASSGEGGGGASLCSSDDQCTATGARCVQHACRVPPAVRFVAPSATTHTNGILHLQVEVTNGTASCVQLFANDAPLTTLRPPFATDWDTSEMLEGTYELVARALVGGQAFESEPRTVIVDRTAPSVLSVEVTAAGTTDGAASWFTNQRPTPVSGTSSEPGATVTISEGGRTVGTAIADEDRAWTTTLDLTPGPRHDLTARATDLAGNSTPAADARSFAITIDQTPLTISDRTPAPGAANVWSRDPITVTFNKPLDPATLSGHRSSPRLTREDASDGDISTIPLASPELSDDRTTLTLRPTYVPQGPCLLTLRLPAGVADAFGNAMAETQWTWTVPEWQDLGVALTVPMRAIPAPRIGLSPDDRPVVGSFVAGILFSSWLAEWTGASGGWSLRFDGFREEVGGVNPSVDFDALGRPVMVWEGSTCSGERCETSDISHGRWDGETFVITRSISSPTISSPARATAPVIRVDALGNQVMAWVETAADDRQRVVARSWNGDWTSIVEVGLASSASYVGWYNPNDGGIDASLDPSGDVRIVWAGVGGRLNSAKWSSAVAQWVPGIDFMTSEILIPEGALAFKVDSAGQNAYFVVQNTTTGVLEIHRTSCFVNMGINCRDVVVDEDPSATDASLALDPDGAPLVAWVAGDKVHVRRWDRTNEIWQQLGTVANGAGRTLSHVSLVVGADGVVAVAYGDWTPISLTAVKRYNGHLPLATSPSPPITAPVPPTVITPPTSLSVVVGSSATFTVTASGPAPMTWQWRKGGVAIPGADRATYSTPATTAADDGTQYDVVIQGRTGGQVTAGPATLTVTSSRATFTAAEP